MSMLTVVIPAYNAARYIGDSISSVLQQPACALNVRIIIVIDGATDETLSAAQDSIREHQHIARILTQNNQGPAAARNLGIINSETKYITFLDADDIWASDYLDTILPILAGNPDLVEYDANLTDQDGALIGHLKIASAPEGCILTAQTNDFLSLFRCYAWARIYKTTAVRSHLFPSGRRFEDNATTPWFYWNSKEIISIGRALIAYRQHPNSVLASPRRQDVLEIAAAISESAAMYVKTDAPYWQHVSYRIFQFACRRLAKQSFSYWRTELRILNSALEAVPAPAIANWLQLRASILYVAWLHFKQKF